MRLTIPPELIQAAQEGDSDAMERLLQTLWPHAYRIARSIIQNDSLAEDAAQEACAIVYRDISQLRSIEAVRVWIYRIVAREAARIAKRQKHEPARLTSHAQSDVVMKLDVLRAIGALPAELRAVIVLHYYADLNSGEIGRVLGVASPTVRFRLSQARRRLEALLDGSDLSKGTACEVTA